MFCSKFMSAVRKWWKKVDDTLIEAAKQSVKIVNNIKQFLESDTAITLTKIIPGDYDESVRVGLIIILKGFLQDSALASDRTRNADSLLTSLVNNIKDLDEKERNALYLKLSSSIAARIHGSKLKEKDYDLACQSCYTLGI